MSRGVRAPLLHSCAHTFQSNCTREWLLRCAVWRISCGAHRAACIVRRVHPPALWHFRLCAPHGVSTLVTPRPPNPFPSLMGPVGRKTSAPTMGRSRSLDATFAARQEAFETKVEALRELLERVRAVGSALRACRGALVSLHESSTRFPWGDAGACTLDGTGALSDGSFAAWESAFSRDVVGVLEKRLEEIPQVRQRIRDREAAEAAVLKLERKVGAGSNGGGSVPGLRARNNERKWREACETYSMVHTDVVQRLDNIERNLGKFVHPAMNAFMRAYGELARAQAQAFCASAAVCENGLEDPFFPVPTKTMEQLLEEDSAHAQRKREAPQEHWDDIDFDDTFVGTANGSTTGKLSDRESEGPLAGHHTAENGAVSAFTTTLSSSSSLASPHSSGSAGVLSRVTSGDVAERPSSHTSSTSTVTDELLQSMAEGGGPASAPLHHLLHQHSTSHGVLPGGAARPRTTPRRTRSMGSARARDRDVQVQQRLYANYAFDPQAPNELRLSVGDVVEVLAKHECGWWQGRVGSATGYFPRNYCRQLSDEEELAFLNTRAARERSTAGAGGGRVGTVLPAAETYERPLPGAPQKSAPALCSG